MTRSCAGFGRSTTKFPVRQGRRFTHYGKSIETVRREERDVSRYQRFHRSLRRRAVDRFRQAGMDESRTQAGLMNIVSHHQGPR